MVAIFDHSYLTSLPVPTAKQTTLFANHVADNHSWYKHLPFFPPGAKFVFFPNPHAGCGVKVDGERFEVYQIATGDYFAHHSWLPTTEYIAQFGHWDYWVDDNPRVVDPQPGPWVYSRNGRRELLSEDLKREWSCRLTAFLKPAPPMFQLRAGQLEREKKTFLASVRPSFGHRLLGRFGGRRDTDPITDRYKALAAAIHGAAGTRDDATLYAFMESEAGAQRAILLSALHRIRMAWATSQGPNADPDAVG